MKHCGYLTFFLVGVIAYLVILIINRKYQNVQVQNVSMMISKTRLTSSFFIALKLGVIVNMIRICCFLAHLFS